MATLESIIDDIKAGNSIRLNNEYRDIIKIVNSYDDTGRTMLHWAAFMGQKDSVSLLINVSANVTLTSENDENFQAIHFAAVNNHTDCIQLFLDVQVSIECCDMFRRSPLSIACFYGRINASVFLLSRGASIDHRDLNGNTVLHFAAMSGNADLCQILIYSGIDVCTVNDIGETALHVASRRGSPRLLKSLLMVNPALLTLTDHKGLTCVTQAKFHRNKDGYQFLQQRLQRSVRILPTFRTKYLIYGRGGSKYPLAFLVCTVFFWAFPTYLSKVLFVTYSDWPLTNWVFVVFSLGFMVSLYAVNSVSPGYLPRYTRDYDAALKGESLRGLSEPEILVALSRLCHSCRAVRPLRASHCGTCGRCVRDKDHHCPYVFNCVGFKNRPYFLLFVVCLWVELALGACFAAIIYFQYGYRFWLHEYLGLCLLSMFFLFVSLVLGSTVIGSLRNLTTNESIKWTQYGYDYLRDSKGRFRNPFDKGYLLNFLEYFRIVVLFKKLDSLVLDI